MASEQAPHALPVSRITAQPIAWLWPGRLALGKLAMLDGDPGLGKSLITLDLCARLSRGLPLPDGGPGPGVVNSIVLNGEDGVEDTIRPRLAALGADLDRVFVLRRTGLKRPLCFPDNLPTLARALQRTAARLVIIDPVVAFLGSGAPSSSDQGVRRALFPLSQLAAKCGCAVVLVRHLSKRGGRSLYRGFGSIGFLGACRSGWLVAADPQAPTRRVLAQVKNNLAPVQPSLGYEVHAEQPAPPVVRWLGVSPWTADQLMGVPAATCVGGALERACDFLEVALEAGPRTTRGLWAEARAQGHSERTLWRARQELEVRSEEVWTDGTKRVYWLLRGQRLRDVLPADEVPPDLEEWLAPLRARFPPSTPLDER
jgi:hypothetical protein